MWLWEDVVGSILQEAEAEIVGSAKVYWRVTNCDSKRTEARLDHDANRPGEQILLVPSKPAPCWVEIARLPCHALAESHPEKAVSWLSLS